MIKKIDIEQFGIFNNYAWNDIIGRQSSFRRVNIIYGRNYSGKTTLSRIFKCIEDGRLHPKYMAGKFAFTLDNQILDNATVATSNHDLQIRVYNKDFVRENLGWLHNEDGTIKPFTVLGSRNVDIDKQIKKIDTILGSIESSSGLIYDYNTKEEVYRSYKIALDKKKSDLDEKLRKKALEIKTDTAAFDVPTYNIATIRSDISKVKDTSLLTQSAIFERRKLIKEELMPNLDRIEPIQLNFEGVRARCRELLESKVEPNIPILELVHNSLLQEWVRNGIEIHKEKKDRCGFCGSTISNSLWNKLNSHFNKESEELRVGLEKEVQQLQQLKEHASNFLKIHRTSFYTTLHPLIDSLLEQWQLMISRFKTSVDLFIDALLSRQMNIFSTMELPEVQDLSRDILRIIEEINLIVDRHNEKSKTLKLDQKAALLELRLSEIAEFANNMNCKGLQEEIDTLQGSLEELSKGLEDVNQEISNYRSQKSELENQTQDESRGAMLINEYLMHFFGHDELTLVADVESTPLVFKIMRDGKIANNLSEGESSLISFCYFIAKIQDALKDAVLSQKLVIYIDDPISSLDSNHVFFMFSLIESVIAKPKQYAQLFISTHNLEFLKYLKKISTPTYKETLDSKKKADVDYFIIERNGKNSELRFAPAYLKNYITEFNYLFHQIYKCSTLDNGNDDHHYHYNFGNNMRKFLEAYLFYKYPSYKLSTDERISKFFSNDQISINLVNRVINEYSHLGEHVDRGLEPVDLSTIKKISQLVVTKIREGDPDQFSALIDSIQ